MKMQKILLLISCMVFPLFMQAQISFNFLPEVHGRTLEGLFMVKIANAQSDAKLVSLTISVSDAKSGKIVVVQSQPFQLRPGMNALPAGVASGAALRFSTNKSATSVRQSNYFPEGDYDYCFELTDVQKKSLIGDQCFNYSLLPFSPLMLMEPFDGDNICDKRPTLFWQPLMPAVPGVQYRLVLAEVKEGQSKVEALNYNLPVINQTGINSPMLFYPPTARTLDLGKRYTWQVMAYKNELLLANSEVWEFLVKCEDTVKLLPPGGFRRIEDLARGNFYIATGRVLFALNNMYNKADLSYTIRCITKPELKISKLPKVKIERGLNHVIMDLPDNRSFVDGYFYILTVKVPGGQDKQLRFLYKKEEAE